MMKPLQGYTFTIPRVLFLDLLKQYVMLGKKEQGETFDHWLLEALKQLAYPRPEKP